MKVVLNYDEASGEMTDKNGATICTWLGLEYEVPGSSVDLAALVKLKNAGFTADEMIELRRKELL